MLSLVEEGSTLNFTNVTSVLQFLRKLWNLAGIDDYANQVEDYVNLFKVVQFSFSEHFLEIWNRQPLFYLFDIVMQQKVFM